MKKPTGQERAAVRKRLKQKERKEALLADAEALGTTPEDLLRLRQLEADVIRARKPEPTSPPAPTLEKPRRQTERGKINWDGYRL